MIWIRDPIALTEVSLWCLLSSNHKPIKCRDPAKKSSRTTPTYLMCIMGLRFSNTKLASQTMCLDKPFNCVSSRTCLTDLNWLGGGVKGLIVTWSNLVVTWKVRPQMDIISWLLLGLHWFTHVGCILAQFVQLNFSICAKKRRKWNYSASRKEDKNK